MSEKTICPCDEKCPLQKTMSAIGGKWKMSVICMLAGEGVKRYNDIKRKLPGVSDTMLAKSLRELETSGLVTRREYVEVPIRVEYAVTEKAEELIPILTELAKWGSTL